MNEKLRKAINARLERYERLQCEVLERGEREFQTVPHCGFLSCQQTEMLGIERAYQEQFAREMMTRRDIEIAEFTGLTLRDIRHLRHEIYLETVSG